MYVVAVYEGEIRLHEFPIAETALKNIVITHGSAQNTLLATPREVYNMPAHLLWSLTPAGSRPKPSLPQLVDVTDNEELTTLATLLNEGLTAGAFKRPGAAKELLTKLKKLLKQGEV